MEDTASTPQPAPQSHHGWTATILLFLFTIAVVWAVNVGLRLAELPFWQECVYCQVDGQWLMATHDAYFWLSGAEEVGRAANLAMPRLLRFFHAATGVDYPTLGFWLPVLLAPLAVLPLCLLAFRWNVPEAALPFGILAAACFGYLIRTRLAYLDDDPLALFFSVALGTALVFWLTPLLRDTWLTNKEKVAEGAMLRPFLPWLGAFGLGLLFRSYMWTYGTAFPIAASMTAIAIGVGLLLARPGFRSLVLGGSVVLLATALGGAPGFVLALSLLVVSVARPSFAVSWWCSSLSLLVFLGVLTLGGHYQSLLWAMIRNVLVYAQIIDPVTGLAPGTASGAMFPSAMESIREGLFPSLTDAVTYMTGHWIVFIPSLLGYCLLLWKRPAALIFLPLLGLGFASTQLGYRFTMYGGVPLAMGFGFLLAFTLHRVSVRPYFRWTMALAVTLLAVLPVFGFTPKLIPRPVMSPQFASALMEMRDISEPNARLWQWWDYGYAAQYYANRHSFGHGGSQHGPWLYPLALVHATQSQLQARQMMLLMAETFAVQEQFQRDREEALGQEPKRHLLDRYSMDPELPFAGMTPESAQDFVDFLGEKTLAWPTGLPPQYLVLALDNFPLSGWISSFGSQNLETGERHPGSFISLPQGVEIASDGQLQLGNVTVPLTSLTVIHDDQMRTFNWNRDESTAPESHVLHIRDANQAYLLDAAMRRSMMFRLLLDDPATVEEHFELVLDRAPLVRVYRAVN